jgi:glycerate 2-kinase
VRIVIAPDKFKGCLTAEQVCVAVAEGLRRVDPTVEIDSCPMADGGEGIVEALVSATGGELITRRVTGPLAEMKVDAVFGMLGDGTTAVIEMSAASGLALLKPEDRNPMRTTSFGTGELMMAAAELGAKRIILGIGGSATIDGGIGVAQACGLPVLLENGEAVSDGEPLTGADVGRVVLVKSGRGSAIDAVEILVASDVANPLYGPEGAAEIFGRQKGASEEQIELLDNMLRQLASRLNAEDWARTPGAGAAGGMGFGMMAMFDAALCPGIELVMEATRLKDRLVGVDLCITGEGCLDATSLSGKTTLGVARMAKAANVPCIGLVGAVGQGADKITEEGMAAYFVISDGPRDLESAMRDAGPLLSGAAANVLRLWQTSRRRHQIMMDSMPPVFAQTPIAGDESDG